MEVPDLKSNHREADPRIALHSFFASSTLESGVAFVFADDEDVYTW